MSHPSFRLSGNGWAASITTFLAAFALLASLLGASFFIRSHVASADTTPLCNGLTATIWVDSGNVIHGGPNNGATYAGTLNGTSNDDVIVGTNGNDVVNAGSGHDTICSLDGNDNVDGASNNDWIDAGEGNNTIDAGSGTNTVFAGNGNNDITGGGNNDTVTVGNGDNIINVGSGTNVVTTGDGNNTVTAGGNNDTITTGSGNDYIDAGSGTNNVHSYGGNDIIIGGGNNDTFDGGDGYDFCDAGSGTNTLTNCEGDDHGLMVVEDSQPDGVQSFDFTNAGAIGNFSLVDDGINLNYATFTPANNTYTITESVTSGWTLADITCYDPTAGTSVNLGARSATITLGSNDHVICIFTNTEDPIADTTPPPVPTHVSPADGSTVSSADLDKVDWSDVTDPSSPVSYYYQSSLSSATNPDGSFVTPAYTSGALSSSEIPTPGTPAGTYYWHVRAEDSAGNYSDWSTPWSVTVVATPACSGSSTFDAFTTGSVNGQGGWSATGSSYDQSVVDNTFGFTSFGCKSLRVSDAVTSGSFGDWIFAPATGSTAGESSVGDVNHYEVQFDFASTMPTEQSGLAVSVSPDDGSGSRMSYLRFEDQSDGVHVIFSDVTDPGPLHTTATFNYTDIATLDRSASHTVKLTIDFYDGPGNDIVKVYIDGSLVHTGRSWEDYYRYDDEQAGNGNTLFPIDTLIIQARGTAHTANSGNGFLFDNLDISTSDVTLDTTRPTLVYNYPASGAWATSTLPVSVTATDAGSGIKNLFVHVYDSLNSLLGSCGSGNGSVGGLATYTYTCTLDTSGYADGSYSFKTGTFDFAGNNKTVSLPFGVDNTKPVVTMDEPVDHATYTGSFTASGTATDATSGIDHILYTVTKIDGLGGSYVSSIDSGTATYTSGTGAWTFDVTGLVDGFYRVKVQAFDVVGNYRYLYHDVQVVNLVPTLAITAPSMNGDFATSTYTFAAQYDNGADTMLSWAIHPGTSCTNTSENVAGNIHGFHDGGTLAGNLFSVSLNTNTTGWPDGGYCLAVDATDAARVTRTFVVDNTAPDAPTLVSPANNAIVNGVTLVNSWTDASSDIDHYRYESYNDAGASSLRFAGDYTTTSKTATNVADTTFWWRVRAMDVAGNWSAWSSLWKLTVDNSVSPGSTAGHLVIVKNTLNGADDTFGFSIFDGSATTTTTLTTSGGTATSAAIDLTPGAYEVTEDASTDWVVSNVSCDDGSPSAIENGESITIATGVTVTCTFTNEPLTTVNQTVYRGSLATSTSDAYLNLSKWFFYNDQTDTLDNGLGAFVSGPGAAPLNEGSAQIAIAGISDGVLLGTYGFAGTMLAHVTDLVYAAYRSTGDSDPALALQFDINTNGTSSPASFGDYEGRLVFEPYLTGATVQTGAWQTWNTMTGTGWWFSHAASTYSGSAASVSTSCTQAAPCTFAQVLTEHPDIGVFGITAFKAGSGWDAFTGNVDDFELTTDDSSHATTTVTDFEPDTGTSITITNEADLASNSSITGVPYTVEWSVTSSGSATPTGTVTVAANGGAGCSADASVGSCDITPSAAGSVTLKASFDGDPGFYDSTSPTAAHEVVDAPTVSTFSTTSGGGGGGGNFSFASIGLGGFGGLVLGASTSTGEGGSQDSSGSSCGPTQFMRFGAANDPQQVLLLQGFLNDFGFGPIDLSGTFGTATENAVKAFQLTYASDILTPWGITEPTGFVYLTTLNKINSLLCPDVSFTLPPLVAWGFGNGGSHSDIAQGGGDSNENGDEQNGSEDNGNGGDNTDQTASAGNAVKGQGFWSNLWHMIFGN